MIDKNDGSSKTDQIVDKSNGGTRANQIGQQKLMGS